MNETSSKTMQITVNMNQPSKETPRHPEALGELLSRPEALWMLYTEALLSAHRTAKRDRREGRA